ncbi:lamin tail domain-containing protein, partial [Candidatus Falkowbacteria bacterium]|nr:lamin tail domain-containing protein [Candidatus Falkowbacteria bacterium]
VVAESTALVEQPAVVEAPATVEPLDVVETSVTVEPSVETAIGAAVISEFVADPSSGDKEWVEMYNNSASVIDLTDWTIEEGSGLKTKLSGGLGFGAYMVFERASLNNSGDIILLKDSTDQIIDKVAYGNWDDGNVADNAPVATKGQSVVRENVTADSGVDSADFKVTAKITKASANELIIPIVLIDTGAQQTQAVVESVVAVEPVVASSSADAATKDKPAVQFSDALVVNEILPDPVGDDAEEWIEIFNTGAVPVNLYKWQIDDADGGSKPYTVDEPLIIQALGYAVFSRKQTAIILNNDKDSSRLIDPAGKAVSSINYSSPVVGQSFARFSTGWQWSAKTTAAAANELPVSASATTGEPNSDSAEENPALAGEIAVVKKYSSLIKTAYAKEIVSAPFTIAADLPAVTLVKAGKVAANMVGKLVTMSGEIVDKSGRKIYLADDSGEAAIYFPTKLSDVNFAMFDLGDKASATGVVKKYKDELRVVARSAQDFVITEKVAAAAKLFSNNQPRKIGWITWLIAGIMAAAAGIYWIICKKRLPT